MLVQLLVAAAFSNLMLLALPVYSGLIFDRVIPHSAFDTLWAISIGVMLALSADIAVRWVRLKIQDSLASSASAAIQASAMRKLLEAKMTEAPRSAGADLAAAAQFRQHDATGPAARHRRRRRSCRSC